MKKYSDVTPRFPRLAGKSIEIMVFENASFPTHCDRAWRRHCGWSIQDVVHLGYFIFQEDKSLWRQPFDLEYFLKHDSEKRLYSLILLCMKKLTVFSCLVSKIRLFALLKSGLWLLYKHSKTFQSFDVNNVALVSCEKILLRLKPNLITDSILTESVYFEKSFYSI